MGEKHYRVVDVHVSIGSDLKGYTLIVGFPGIGLVGPIVARHLIESRHMKLVGTISSPDFPAVSAIRNGVALPPVRIYADDEKKIAVVVSEVMFSEGSAKKLGAALIDAAKKQGIKRIVSIAGVLMPGGGGATIFGAASHPDDVKYLMRYGITPVEKGITTGISATLLTHGQTKSVNVVLVLGTLRAKEDFRAAAEIVKKLDEMLNLDIPYDALLERAAEIERDVSHIVSQAKNRESPMYG